MPKGKKRKKNRRAAAMYSGLPSIKEFQRFMASFMKLYNLNDFTAELTDAGLEIDYYIIEGCENTHTDKDFTKSLEAIGMFMEIYDFAAIGCEAVENSYKLHTYKKSNARAENIAAAPYNVMNTMTENKKHFAQATNFLQSV